MTATSVLGLLRLGGDPTILDLGGGLAFVEDAVPAIAIGVGWEVVQNLAIKLRADGVFDGEPTVPVGLAFSYAFDSGGS